LADEGRERGDPFKVPHISEDLANALQDGANLQSLELKDIYSILIKKRIKQEEIILHPESLEDSKIVLEYETGLRPTNEAILKGIWRLPILPRMRDHLWTLNIGRIKCGSYWQHIPKFEDRAYCAACEAHGLREATESPTHLWRECEYNGQYKAWLYAKILWQKSTRKPWPQISLALVKGSPAISLSEQNADENESKRMRIIISTTTWAIWKTRNRLTISQTPIKDTDAAKLTGELLKDMITKSWNAIRTEKKSRKEKKRASLKKLWGEKLVTWPETESKPLRFGF